MEADVMIKKIAYYVLQLKAFTVFGRRVHAHGNFKVGNSKNVTIGNHCGINEGVYILGHSRTSIGNRVVLSARVMLIDSGLDLSASSRPHLDGRIIIEDDVWVGAGAVILDGVHVGRGAVVGAGAVITRDVAPGDIVAGVPARRIGSRADRGRPVVIAGGAPAAAALSRLGDAT